jgi:hypothetical protein
MSLGARRGSACYGLSAACELVTSAALTVRSMPVEFLTDDEAAAYGRYAGPPSQADLDRVFFLTMTWSWSGGIAGST